MPVSTPAERNLVCEIFYSFRLLCLLCIQHLNHRNLPDDLDRDKFWPVFSTPQNSELFTMTLPPQQAKTQRMRLKTSLNPNEDEDGNNPLQLCLLPRPKLEQIFPVIAPLKIEIGWELRNQTIVPILPRSILMCPRNEDHQSAPVESLKDF